MEDTKNSFACKLCEQKFHNAIFLTKHFQLVHPPATQPSESLHEKNKILESNFGNSLLTPNNYIDFEFVAVNEIENESSIIEEHKETKILNQQEKIHNVKSPIIETNKVNGPENFIGGLQFSTLRPAHKEAHISTSNNNQKLRKSTCENSKASFKEANEYPLKICRYIDSKEIICRRNLQMVTSQTMFCDCTKDAKQGCNFSTKKR